LLPPESTHAEREREIVDIPSSGTRADVQRRSSERKIDNEREIECVYTDRLGSSNVVNIPHP
jgi:hypothetical protein